LIDKPKDVRALLNVDRDTFAAMYEPPVLAARLSGSDVFHLHRTIPIDSTPKKQPDLIDYPR
jgi:hypothetical protein